MAISDRIAEDYLWERCIVSVRGQFFQVREGDWIRGVHFLGSPFKGVVERFQFSNTGHNTLVLAGQNFGWVIDQLDIQEVLFAPL